jgi:outer membrane protein TolC
MRRCTEWRLAPWIAIGTVTACASVDPRPDYEDARRSIRAATGEAEPYDPEKPVLTDSEIDAVLDGGLELVEATRLALRNNRRLQAGFMSLGVSRADYVQAGLFQNPNLSLAFLFPDSGRVRWTADLFGSVSDVWQIPARQELARAGLEQRILDLSRYAGELVAETRAAYFEAVAAREARAVTRSNSDLARRSLEGVRRQVGAGQASKSEEALAEGLALGADYAFQRSERDVASSVRRLAALLSLDADLLAVELNDPLPAPIARGYDRESIVERSLGSRADVRAAERAVAAAAERVRLERNSRFGLGAGVSAERPEGGGSTDFLVGPAASIELPIFDQNQAQISRAEFELAERTKEREALLSEIRQEVRAALDRAEIAARVASFARDEFVPQSVSTALLAERAYELGDTTVLTLLQAQKAALDARRMEVEALLDAARSRIELERAVGSPLEALPDT